MKRLCLIWILLTGAVWADRADLGSDELEAYFEGQVGALEGQLEEIEAKDYQAQQGEDRRRLREMLGLDPMPARTPLVAKVTGKVEREDFVVENLHFQSSPGLYVTGNLYLPKKREGKVPVVLYVCGHGPVKIDGVSYGNKVHYQHHGIWFARNGYACLVIDTLQLGEIEGVHHGTYNHGRWWWHARGYTSAGVEAWNCVRALDYLETRDEIDAERMGVTGRSGGGAYSWWIATIDERIKVAVPVAGIASLRNHVVDGTVEGHCDCMFHLNTYRWDFERIAALVTPRPLLISNTDKDSIFPLDGVYQVYQPVRRLYELNGAAGKLGLNIEEGPHKDTQPLRTSAFHWMNRHLKGTDAGDTFEMAAVKLLEPKELKVFAELPKDEINTKIDEIFVPVAGAPALPKNEAEWEEMRERWMAGLKKQSFAGWPHSSKAREVQIVDFSVVEGMQVKVINYQSQPNVTCSIFLLQKEGSKLEEIEELDLRIVDGTIIKRWVENPERPRSSKNAIAFLRSRGLGDHEWKALKDKRKATQILRRFAMVGQTLDGMRVHDIVSGIGLLQGAISKKAVIRVDAERAMAGNALYASLFLQKPVERLSLHDLPASHREGPIYLNVLKIMDLPQALAMAAERTEIAVYGPAEPWSYAHKIAERFGWPKERLVFKDAPRN